MSTPMSGTGTRGGMRWPRRNSTCWGLAIGLCALAVAPLGARADNGDRPPRYEASFGIGGAGASESSIFNLSIDSKSQPDALFDFRLRQNLTETFALGFHLYGTGEETPSYIVTDVNGNVIGSATYNLSIFHVGVDVRYLLLEPPFQPYFDVGVSFVSGSITGKNEGTLQLSGGSVGGGPGVLFRLNPRFSLGAQGLFAVGSAKWEKRPFVNSDGRDYDPGIAGGEAFVAFRWGH